jgi:hypothetical protein
MRRWFLPLLLWMATIPPAGRPAHAIELRLEPSILGQVRNGYWTDETEAPIELYGDLGVSRLPHGTTIDAYFRLEEDFATWDDETDFFIGAMRVPAAPGGLDVQLGRQIVAESPVGLWDADSGQVRLGVDGTPLSFTVFGGQPRSWEPTYGPELISQDEQIFGGSMRLMRFQGGALALGYLQQNRQGQELMQQVTLSGTRTFADLPGWPSLYGNFALDSDQANIDQARVGVQSFVWRPNLLFNLESGYYKPQDGGDVVVRNLDRREDSVFQLFSVSELLQVRGGLRWQMSRTLSAFTDLSYQRYERTQESFVDGYVWSTGALYLPGGDGLEMVRVEYYGIDGVGGSVNGGRVYYENRVYEQILFRAKCDVAYYDKATNQDGTAIGSLVGVGYELAQGLVAEVNFEANRNQFFPEDYRFGFFFTYSAGYATQPELRRDSTGSDGRPWPWAPAQTGPASWGVRPARWTRDPGLPSSGWASPTFASVAATREAEKERAAAEGSDAAGEDVPGRSPAARSASATEAE